jgi:formylglycine-generating enzyme required for sulfatase activity
VEAQTFEMGCTPGQGGDCEPDEEPAHMVTLTHSWVMDSTEVTQGEYARLMEGATPSYSSSCGDDCPVEKVSWHMAADYANARSVENGLVPFYHCSGEGTSVTCGPKGDPYESEGWRLPTEAEWEASARCGTDLKYAGSDDLDEVGWYSDNSDSETHPVGEKEPNACGLYDMSGNVWEWVNDGYDSEGYDRGDVENPDGLSSVVKVYRGGRCDYPESIARVSYRGEVDPRARYDYHGFRLVRPIF